MFHVALSHDAEWVWCVWALGVYFILGVRVDKNDGNDTTQGSRFMYMYVFLNSAPI